MRIVCCICLIALVVCLPLSADAQILGGLTLNPTAVVSPQNPRIDVEIWAWFDYIPGQAEYFAAVEFDLHAAEPNWPSIRDGQIVGPGAGILFLYHPPMFTGESILDLKIVNYFYAPPISIPASDLPPFSVPGPMRVGG